MDNPNYKIFIEMLARFINTDYFIRMIDSKSTDFDSIIYINPALYKIETYDGIEYITALTQEYLSHIITSFNDTSNKYYLTLDTKIYTELLSDEEIAAEKKAQEAAEKAK